eukprot:TRINITY_DN649_c0_g1_i1.p1 TRINITY_DN649_c0_g1~~TRINITY_DN649_c0_g1_i1.p1  ORF type:complete len:233 (-),score=47.43 TRINITY_DN649_c0_g1_i1:69-767(-)
MKYTSLLFVLLAIGLASAFSLNLRDKEQRCSPDRWEAGLFSWFPESNFMAYTNLSYDWKGKQIAMDIFSKHTHQDDDKSGSGDHHKDGHAYKILLHFGEKKVWYVDHESGNCTVRPIMHSMEKACVPKDHRYLASSSIADGVDVDILLWKKEIHDKEVTIVYTVTKDKSIPIEFKYSSSHHGATTNFYEVSEGIEDYTVFDAPGGCEEAPARSGRNVGSPFGRDMWENLFFM